MIPTGGLSVFIHLFINAYALAAKRFPVLKRLARFFHIPAPVVGAVLVSTIVYFSSSLLINALNDDNNFDHLAFLQDRCTEQSFTPSGKDVVLRVDDIQAYAWGETSRRIIDDATSYGIPLSLAVIPINLRDDFTFYEYLRNQRCEVEFMLHGWDNQEPRPDVGEFAELSKSDARERLGEGIAVMDRLSRQSLVSFVPPLNQMSTGTKEALDELKFKVISTEDDGYYYDYDVTTFDFDVDELVPADEVLRGCEEKFASGDTLCVIMIHPQDFVTDNKLDQEKYKEYEDLLWGLHESEYNVVRFKDFVPEESGTFTNILRALGL